MAKILVVDDEPDALDLVAFNLKQAGLDVVTADDGAAANGPLRRCSRCGSEPNAGAAGASDSAACADCDGFPLGAGAEASAASSGEEVPAPARFVLKKLPCPREKVAT